MRRDSANFILSITVSALSLFFFVSNFSKEESALFKCYWWCLRKFRIVLSSHDQCSKGRHSPVLTFWKLPLITDTLFLAVFPVRQVETWCSYWTYNKGSYFYMQDGVLIKELQLPLNVILKVKNFPISLLHLVPQFDLIIPSSVYFCRLESTKVFREEIDRQTSLLNPYSSLTQVYICISERDWQKNFLIHIFWL